MSARMKQVGRFSIYVIAGFVVVGGMTYLATFVALYFLSGTVTIQSPRVITLIGGLLGGCIGSIIHARRLIAELRKD